MALPVLFVGGVAAGAEAVSNIGSGQGLLRNLNQMVGKFKCATDQAFGNDGDKSCKANKEPGHEHDAYANAPFSSFPRFL